MYKFGSRKRLKDATEQLTKGTDCNGSDNNGLGLRGLVINQMTNVQIWEKRYIHSVF